MLQNPKAIPYIRFSSLVQGKGSSVERQQQYINEWLKAHPKVALSDLRYEDLGKSGYSGKHLENDLGKLLQAIETGHIKKGDYVLVEAMDRLGRLEEWDMLDLIGKIAKAGVKIVTLQDNTEYSKESIAENAGLLYLLVGKVQMAHQYSKQLSERVSKAWVAKAKDAKAGKGVKRKAPWWISWNEKTERYDTVTDEDSQILTKVFQDYLTGFGERRILNRLRESHPKKFGTTDPASVKRWLKNKTAIGYWNDIPNVYPAAISETLFYQVQKALEDRKTGKPQTQPSGHFLSGLVKCGCCGGNYAMRSNKHSRDAMLCSISNKRKDKCTNSKTIPVQILSWLVHETYQDAIAEIERRSVKSDSDEKLVVIDGELSDLEKQMSNLLDTVQYTGMTESLGSRLKELGEKKTQLETDRAGIVQSSTGDIDNCYSHLSVLGSEMLTDDPSALSELLQQVGYKIVCNGSVMECNGYKVEYLKWSRKNDCYHLVEHLEDGEVNEFTIPVMRDPSSEELEGQTTKISKLKTIEEMEAALEELQNIQ